MILITTEVAAVAATSRELSSSSKSHKNLKRETLFIIKFTCLSNNFLMHARQKFPHHGTLELSISFHLSHYYLLYVYGNVDGRSGNDEHV